MKKTNKLTEGQKTIKKYFSDEYTRRDTPALIRYEHTNLSKDLLILLAEYEYDCRFLSLSLMDGVLDKIEQIVSELNMNHNRSVSDMNLIDSCWSSYDVVFKYRENEFNKLAIEQWEFEEFDDLMEELNITTNNQKHIEPKPKKFSSEFKGVSWQKSANKWRVMIKFKGKQKYIGLFSDELEASEAHDAALLNWENKGIEPEPKKFTSKFKGVCWHKNSNKWLAYIHVNGKRKRLGSFTDELEASNAYQKALSEII